MQSLKRWSNRSKIFVVFLVVIFGFGSYVWGNKTQDKESNNIAESMPSEYAYQISQMDQEVTYTNPVYLDLEQDVIGPIEAGGDYVLRGKKDGTVKVDAKDENVHLILNGVELKSSTGPAIQIISAGKVVITVAEGTENIISDSGDYREFEECNAAIWSACDVTINGNGTLQVYGYYKDAIHTKDVLKVIGGNIYLQAKRDGIRGNDGILLKPQYISMECEGVGLHTTNAQKEGKGIIDIADGNIVITAGTYAIQSAADLYIRECDIACFSVMADFLANGKYYIEEGCMQHE